MSPETLMRKAKPDEAERIATVWHAGWRDGHIGHVEVELIRARTAESFRLRASSRIESTRVAVVDGEVAGFVMVVDDEVEQVYLSADHRGAGVADVLMTDAEAQVAEAGHDLAWLAVVAGNARARRFYERRGWSDAGLFDYHAANGEGSILVPSHRYEKRVR